MDRETELQHLAEADRLIEDGQQNIARVKELIAGAIARGADVTQPSRHSEL